MQIYDIIDQMAKEAKTSVNALEHEIWNSNNITAGKGRGSVPSLEKVAKIAEECGFALCIVQANKIPKHAIVIDPDQK